MRFAGRRESEQDQQDGDGDNVVACIHSDPNTFALQFDYDPDTDDPRMVVDELAAALPEMGQKELSSIDHDICVSALKECINKLSM